VQELKPKNMTGTRNKPQRLLIAGVAVVVILLFVFSIYQINSNQTSEEESSGATSTTTIQETVIPTTGAGVGADVTSIDREAYIQARIDEWVAAGWAKVEYTDDGSLIAFSLYHSDSTQLVWGSSSEEQQEWKDNYLAEAQSISIRTGSNVILIFYANDNEQFYSAFASFLE
jgi:hypothetical protein